MSVASSVIERNTFLQQPKEREVSVGNKEAEELHNARMKNNLARLLNPANNIQDVVASIDAEGTQVIQTTPPKQEPSVPLTASEILYGRKSESHAVQPAMSAPVQPVMSAPVQPAQQPVYMVTGARADADIFRADSPVNRQVYASTPAEAYAAAKAIAAANAAAQAAAAPQIHEEESEDLRPTATTIQYQTIGADGTVIIDSPARVRQEGEIARPEEREEKVKKLTLTRRDKVIIGVIVSLILAVFVLIIVNSAIISNLNSDIDMLEGMADAARTAFNSSVSEYNELVSYDNVFNVALEQGWLN